MSRICVRQKQKIKVSNLLKVKIYNLSKPLCIILKYKIYKGNVYFLFKDIKQILLIINTINNTCSFVIKTGIRSVVHKIFGEPQEIFDN